MIMKQIAGCPSGARPARERNKHIGITRGTRGARAVRGRSYDSTRYARVVLGQQRIAEARGRKHT